MKVTAQDIIDAEKVLAENRKVDGTQRSVLIANAGAIADAINTATEKREGATASGKANTEEKTVTDAARNLAKAESPAGEVGKK